MKLIPEWKSAWKMFSVQAAALIAIWQLIPVEAQAKMLSSVGMEEVSIPLVLSLVGIVGRLIAQPKLRAVEVTDTVYPQDDQHP